MDPRRGQAGDRDAVVLEGPRPRRGLDRRHARQRGSRHDGGRLSLRRAGGDRPGAPAARVCRGGHAARAGRGGRARMATCRRSCTPPTPAVPSTNEWDTPQSARTRSSSRSASSKATDAHAANAPVCGCSQCLPPLLDRPVRRSASRADRGADHPCGRQRSHLDGRPGTALGRSHRRGAARTSSPSAPATRSVCARLA